MTNTFIHKILCFFGLHEYDYHRDLFDRGINKPKLLTFTKSCKHCGEIKKCTGIEYHQNKKL